MVKFSLDGVEIEAEAGAPLVEVIKQNGTFISNLCYIDGLQPYAGCRTCLVEIEGARGLQLACTSRVQEGMVVRANTAQVLEARQSVVSIINANHSDRCLTCHRRVHCQPGDICLRDDTVTHRCLTCAKNYRCELQTTNEMLNMANVEPWLGEERTYYQSEQPEADRANPFLEFDPQMCIICTRCVRACDEIRHTGAITLAGRGFSTRIAFGSGGAIHESSCDFCGACIDVCPTATLLEKPNKWIAKTEEWVSTTCNACSVGCTLSMGVRNGKVVMVKPDRLNPVSWDQICVRGRFHYDAVKPRERLTRHLVMENGVQSPVPFETAIEQAASRLERVIKAHGPASVGFLIGPWSTNEEAYAAQKLARGLIGTENIDSSAGPLARAVDGALSGAFGTAALPANLETVAQAKTIVVVAEDLESSNNVISLRVKDAVVRNGARLIVVSSRFGEVCDYIAPPPAGSILPSPQRVHSSAPTGVWLRPVAGGETATVAALNRLIAESLAEKPVDVDQVLDGVTAAPGVDAADLQNAATILAGSEGNLAVIYVPTPASPELAAEATKAVANLAILCRGPQAAESLFVMPAAPNARGTTDMGAVPGESGQRIAEMLNGGVKALVVAGDNPMMHLPNQAATEAGLKALDSLIVISTMPTDTARLADVVFADLPVYGKDGTYTNADRRVLRLSRGETATGNQRDALETMAALGLALADKLGKTFEGAATAEAVMAEASLAVDGYAGADYAHLESGVTRALRQPVSAARLQAVTPPALPAAEGQLILTTSRSLYTSLEGASIHSEEADKLHREEFLEINPSDAMALRIGQNHPVLVSNGREELTLSAALTDAVAPGSVYLPLYFDGGIVNRLLSGDAAIQTVTVRPALPVSV